jgi:regulator of protease activity HflC (stomatin/prohibitin superfamily)
VKTQHHIFPDLNVGSRESASVLVTATLNMNIDPNKVEQLYRNVGSNWFDAIVEPRVLNDLKDETVRYTAVGLLPNRERIRRDVVVRLKGDLSTYGIDVTDFLLPNISLPVSLQSHIEAKLAARQDAQAAQNRVAVVQAQARQQVARAQGERDAAIARAQGQAQANRLLAASLRDNPNLIEYTKAQAMLALASNRSTKVIPSGSIFNFGNGSTP